MAFLIDNIWIAFGAYFLLPAVIRKVMASVWLWSFEREKLRNMLWWSWGWTCFAVPVLWCLTVVSSAIAFENLLSSESPFRIEHWPLFLVRSVLGAVYLLPCLGFDWWLTRLWIKPRDTQERRRITLWVWCCNTLWGVCFVVLAGIVFRWSLGLPTDV